MPSVSTTFGTPPRRDSKEHVCGLLCAVCEVFEVQVLVVVGSAVRRLRGGSFVCASGVLAVDVAAILRHDSWASAIVCHTSSRSGTRLGHTTYG